jgi:hypothetical protein
MKSHQQSHEHGYPSEVEANIHSKHLKIDKYRVCFIMNKLVVINRD